MTAVYFVILSLLSYSKYYEYSFCQCCEKSQSSNALLKQCEIMFDNSNRTYDDNIRLSRLVFELSANPSQQTISFLISHIDFEPMKGIPYYNSLPSLKKYYPCVYALSEIGPPAYDQLIANALLRKQSNINFLTSMAFRKSLGIKYSVMIFEYQALKCTIRSDRKVFEDLIFHAKQKNTIIGVDNQSVNK